MPPTKQRRKSDRVMACKQCPACEDQVPVACKSCPCGHLFPTRSKAKQKKLEDANRGDNSGQDSNTAASEADKSGVNDGTDVPAKRRTVRTKRFPPDFFTPMDDQTPKRKTKEASGKSPDKVKRRRNRSKSSTSSVKEDASKQAPASTPDDDLFANMPAEKALQYSVILAELNRKMTTQHFRPL